jgi:tape measure domain-containing protein
MALTIKIRADASHFKKTIAGIEVQASGLTGVMGKLATSQAAFGAALAAAAAGALALGAGLAFIKDASGKAAGMESLQVQFEVLTKSASKATELIKSFRDEAVKSPLSVQDYAQAGKTLMAFGIAADETLPILKTLGDVSMGNADRFGSLALAFAQTQAAGRLMGQEVLQFVNAGFNPLQEISRRTGKSMIELKKAMEDGAISADMVTEAFRSATAEGGLFYGALDKGAATTEGKIAKLGDSILGLKVAFGTGFNEGLKTALDATNSFLPQLESRFATAGDFLGKALTESISGDTEKFAALGVLVGTAFWEGFKEIGGNVIVESIRGIIQSTAGASDREQQLMSGKLTGLLGPKPTMQDMIGNVRTGLQPALEGMERANAPDWNKQLEEQRRRVDQEILNENKKTNQLLQKAAPGNQPMFSR